MLLEAQSEADFLEPIVLFKNRATGSNAIANDATQTTANDQPLSLPLIDGGGYLYQPDVTGNAPAVNIPSISANEDFVFEMEVYLVNATSFHLASGDSVNKRFAVHSNFFYFSPESGACAPLSTGASTLTVERSGATATLKQDGVVKATLSANIADNAYDFTHLSFNGQYLTSIGKLNGYIKTATLSIEGTEVFNCDFADTSIEDGASSFDCSTGQTVTISTGSGVDQARIVRRPKAVFNASEMDFIHTNVSDAFFVCATESGVVSGVFDTSLNKNKFSGNGALKNSYRTDFLQTLWGMWPNTISDSQKQALVDYAKSKSAGKNWAGIENFISFFRGSNLNSLDASYWDTGSATNFSYFLRGATKLESLDIRGWDTSSVVSMDNFARLTSLINISIDGNTFSDSACTDYTAAFTDTNLNQATIDDILVRINAAGTSNGTFGRTGGEYPSTTGVAAKDALEARGWSMTFSSDVLPSVLDLEPAAAYSLRALKSSEDPNVVRVRRSSDGALSNFKASEVSDGTLTGWVNTEYETVINGEFTTDSDWSKGSGWDIANGKATSDGTQTGVSFLSQASNMGASQSQRVTLVVSDYTAGTVRVRLGVSAPNSSITSQVSSNGTHVFTLPSHSEPSVLFIEASADFQGSLESISVIQLTADGHVTTWHDQREIVETGSAYGTTISGTADGTFTTHNQIAPAVAGEFYRVRFTASNLSPRGRLRFRSYAGNANITVSAGLAQMNYFNANGDYESYVPSDDGLSLYFYADVGQSFDYSEVSVQQVAEVPNDASQTLVSNMPKLVDGGTLVTEGGLPALDFDGVNSLLKLEHSDLYGQSVLDSYYVTSTTDNAYLYPASGSSSPYGMVGESNPHGTTSSNYGSPTYYANGTEITPISRINIHTATSGGQKLVAHVGASTTNSGWSSMLFGIYTSTHTFAYNGKLQEMIFFNTDQSANRTAIENNINSHFTIYS